MDMECPLLQISRSRVTFEQPWLVRHRAEIRASTGPADHAAIEGRILYKKVLLAYEGSIGGRRALREGAKLAQFCGADVFLLAVVEISSSVATLERGFTIPIPDAQLTVREGAT